MRKTVIALMLVLPMLFLLVVFTTVNSASVSTAVSVNGIRIYADGDLLADGKALEIDHTANVVHKVTAEVEPTTAADKGYTLESDNPEVVEVSSDGTVVTHGEGSANITATSNDKGLQASLPVVVSAGLVYGVHFTLFEDADNAKVVPLRYNEDAQTYSMPNNSVMLDAGTYYYNVSFDGGSSREYSLATAEDSDAVVNTGSNSLFLPFSGTIRFDLSVDNAFQNGLADQTITQSINLRVRKPTSQTGIIVNGEADGNSVLLAKGSTQTTMYVESEEEPVFQCEHATAVCLTHMQARAASDRHVMQITVEEGFEADELDATLTANGQTAPIKLSFSDFDFNIRSNIIKETAGVYSSVILKNTATTFFAVPAVDAHDVSFVWECDNSNVTLVTSDDALSCSVKANEEAEFTITVQAKRDGENLGAAKQINITSVTKVTSIRIRSAANLDLAERYTVGGRIYDANGSLVDNDKFEIKIDGIKSDGPFTGNTTGIEVSVDGTAAKTEVREGKVYLVPLATGAVSVTAYWEYNELFGGKASFTINYNIVKDAVEVGNYSQLKKATDAGEKVVLTKNIALGTDDEFDASLKSTDINFAANLAHVLPIEERQAIISAQSCESTYNTVFYKTHPDYKDRSTEFNYAMEFKADVYGNGFNIDANYFTAAIDGAGQPVIFRGPLIFVEYKGVAKVAGQDNCAFLIRTDGVKLYGVNLLGCSDDNLFDNGKYELNKLNYIGTTLDINADCEIVNCRIRNGRNVVRVYGGNKDGSHYFVNSLAASDLSADEQIKVTIEGCIITQGREFLVKVGSNKALQSYYPNGQEPELRAANGAPYRETSKNIDGKNYYTNNYTIDDPDFFYRRYVMTDLTLKNSVLETSGLFCVGMESNFSGALLYEGAKDLTGTNAPYASATPYWRTAGGTSFASILRLEGDVRLYDWKDVANVDSSTLIEPVGDGVLSEVMKFDVSSLLQEVDGKPEYANLLYRTTDEESNELTFVHGGIAYYGGGRNYSQIDLTKLNAELNNLTKLSINIGQFDSSGNAVVKRQGQLLPLAAGTHDFNFWLYSADGANGYEWQQNKSYSGVTKVPLFEQ